MARSSRPKLGRIVLIAARIALAGIFLVAAFAKLRPLDGMPWTLGSVRASLAFFAVGVDSYQILPPWGVTLVGHWLPLFETVLGLWLLSGIALRFSSVVSTLAICTFSFTPCFRRTSAA